VISDLEASDKVLAETPGRALKFLGAVSRHRVIRAILAMRGYTQAVHERGFALTLAAAGFRKPVQLVPDTPEASAALAKVDAWDEPNFRIASVALAVDFPEQHAFVFQDLTAQVGAASIGSVTTFLDRLDELETGKDRKATRKVDHAALAKLAERGIPPEERARVRDLLALAKSAPADDGFELVAADDAQAVPPEQRAAQVALRAWYVEWSEIAKAVIKRRDHLILLGLAKRKTKKKGAAEAPAGGNGGQPGGANGGGK
jgi:hypothetical protein